MMRITKIFALACSPAYAARVKEAKPSNTTVLKPSGNPYAVIDISPDAVAKRNAANATSPNHGIQYHGGPVMNDPDDTNVYFVWYGGLEQRQGCPDNTHRLHSPPRRRLRSISMRPVGGSVAILGCNSSNLPPQAIAVSNLSRSE
jgi:hypothetical protein